MLTISVNNSIERGGAQSDRLQIYDRIIIYLFFFIQIQDILHHFQLPIASELGWQLSFLLIICDIYSLSLDCAH